MCDSLFDMYTCTHTAHQPAASAPDARERLERADGPWRDRERKTCDAGRCDEVAAHSTTRRSTELSQKM